MWHFPPQNLELLQNDVHLWCSPLDLSSTQLSAFVSLLSCDEHAKAQRFRFDKHRRRYIIAHGMLRIILARYLKIEPQQVEFEYSSRGKPRILGTNIQFNLSHSHEMALYGITDDCPIGVDIEQLRPMTDAAAIANRFFCATESAIIEGLTSPEQENAFFQLWTAKEAYLKATGEGLGGGLDRVEIALNRGIHLLSINGILSEAEQWQLCSFPLFSAYRGAVVVWGKKKNFQYFNLS